MINDMFRKELSLICVWGMAGWTLQAGDLDTIGVTELRAHDASLNGANVVVGQVEAQELPVNSGKYQPDPADANLSPSLFSYYEQSSQFPTATTFSAAKESGHANSVASRYYDGATGVAPGVAGIRCFEAGYFYNYLINTASPPDIGAKVVNQSFLFDNYYTGVDQQYDNYAASRNILFVNGAGNDPTKPPLSPATMYNGIAVGLMDAYSDRSIGPLSDGRIKPDLVAPSGVTSYSAPYVAGAAAVLVQAATRGDGGNSTATTASDIRTLKALLLNGAVKPSTWTRVGTEPLDRKLGAGILNINRSHLQLQGGKHVPIATVDTPSGDPHPPATTSNNNSSIIGWNNNTLTTPQQGRGANVTYSDITDHYFFNLPSADSNLYQATVTLVWNRQNGLTGINNLNLYLYNATTGALVAESVSTVDNVEHIHLTQLPAGRYNLQVLKAAANRVSTSETYSAAFQFSPVPKPAAPSQPTITALSSTSLRVQWVDASNDETGFRIERSLSPGSGFTSVATPAAGATSYDDSGLTAGTTYYYRIIAVSGAGDSPAATASGTTLTQLENWRMTYFGASSNSGQAADGADVDGDGRSNLFEYAVGSDPTNPAEPAPVSVVQDPLRLKVAFNRIADPALNYELWASGNLSDWGVAPIWSSTGLENTNGTVVVTDTQDMSAALRRFLQLRVTRNPDP